MTTDNPIVINVPFKDLHPEHSRDSISPLDRSNPIGVTFAITRQEYDYLRNTQLWISIRGDFVLPPVTCECAVFRMQLNLAANFTLNGRAFLPGRTRINVDPSTMTLRLYNRDDASICVQADVTELLAKAF